MRAVMRFAARAPLLLLLVFALAGCGKDSSSPPPGGPPFELSDFQAPETCGQCHPNHYAEWSTSMHAYAFKDPVFFAMNFAEAERTNGDLRQFCIGCHTPIGTLTGTTPDGRFDPATMPAIVQAGISCDVCHSVVEAAPGATEAGTTLTLRPGDTKYGPLPALQGSNFHRTEQRIELFENSTFCRACHNLTVRGLEVEETFDEWEESIYASRGDSHCQDCHMPRYSGRAAIDGPERPRLHRHWFTGVDVAVTTEFPGRREAKDRVADLLRNSVAFAVAAPDSAAAGDTFTVAVTVTNDRTGHAIPSGTSFSRQMWIEVTATAGSDTLYRSGHLDPAGDLLDPARDPDLVNFTTVLEGGDGVTIFTATGIQNRLLQVNESRTASYRVPVPAVAAGPVEVAVRLRFRPFPPFKVRRLGRGDLVAEIPIFEMADAARTVAVR
jgi:hypothetical protein